MRAGFERIGRSVTVGQAKRKCLDKIRYTSRNKARDTAARKANAHPEWATLSPYRCTLCGGWHLTTSQHRANPMPRLEKQPKPRKNQPS